MNILALYIAVRQPFPLALHFPTHMMSFFLCTSTAALYYTADQLSGSDCQLLSDANVNCQTFSKYSIHLNGYVLVFRFGLLSGGWNMSCCWCSFSRTVPLLPVCYAQLHQKQIRRPHDKRRAAFSEFSTLRPVLKKMRFQVMRFQDPCGWSVKTMQYMCIFAKERFCVDGPLKSCTIRGVAAFEWQPASSCLRAFDSAHSCHWRSPLSLVCGVCA